MPFLVQVSPEVACVGDGTRRRGGLVFSSTPRLVMDLTPEIVADAMLVIRAKDDDQAAAPPEPLPVMEAAPEAVSADVDAVEVAPPTPTRAIPKRRAKR